MYHLLVEKGFGADYPQIYALPMLEKVKPEWKIVNEQVKGIKDLEITEIVNDVRDKVEIGQKALMTLAEINLVAQAIKEETDFGLMLYYGSAEVEGAGIYKEPKYYKKLLQHIILGLKTIQHKGNLVIKVTLPHLTPSIAVRILLEPDGLPPVPALPPLRLPPPGQTPRLLPAHLSNLSY